MIGSLLFAIMQTGSAVDMNPGSAIDAAAATNSGQYTLVCENPAGSTVYLPGGLVPQDMALVREDDAFGGLVTLELVIQPDAVQVKDVTWVRPEQELSALESGTISQTLVFSSGTVRVFVLWADGSSDTVMINGIQTDQPVLAYTSAYTGSGLERVSHFSARCEWLAPEG